jgi:hypothetical protein
MKNTREISIFISEPLQEYYLKKTDLLLQRILECAPKLTPDFVEEDVKGFNKCANELHILLALYNNRCGGSTSALMSDIINI